MTKCNGLSRNTPPRKISKKRAKKIKDDKSYYMGLKRTKKPRMVSVKQAIKMKQDSKVKQEIRQRANGHCEICNLEACPPTYKIEVHEIVFRSALGKVSLENSRGLCSCCHWFLQRYTFRQNKETCIGIIQRWRNISKQDTTIIYEKIMEFCKEYDLLEVK